MRITISTGNFKALEAVARDAGKVMNRSGARELGGGRVEIEVDQEVHAALAAVDPDPDKALAKVFTGQHRKPMTERQALAEARRRWGKDGCVSTKANALRAPEREAARLELKRLQETLSKDERRARKAELQALAGRSYSFPFSVGELYRLPGLGAGMRILGEGDTWEEAFAAATKGGR